MKSADIDGFSAGKNSEWLSTPLAGIEFVDFNAAGYDVRSDVRVELFGHATRGIGAHGKSVGVRVIAEEITVGEEGLSNEPGGTGVEGSSVQGKVFGGVEEKDGECGGVGGGCVEIRASDEDSRGEDDSKCA